MPTVRYTSALVVLTSAAGLAGCDGEVTLHDGHPAPQYNTISVDASISGYDWEAYGTHVPYGTQDLVVDLHNLSADADLYVESPDGAYACESLLTGTRTETCDFEYPMTGDWYVEVFGWEYDTLDYTLSVTLWPSDLEASLWWLESVTSHALGTLSLQKADSANAAAQRLLPVIKAGVERAITSAAGESAFRIRSPDGAALGTVLLDVEPRGHRSAIHIKAVAADPETGARHVIQTAPSRPVLISAYALKPEDGLLRIRRKDQETTVRLGSATGTTADVELLSKPGPLVSTLAWEAIEQGDLSLREP